MKRYKIMFLTTSLTVGGAEKVLYETVLGINREKYNLSVCCIKGPGYFGKKLQEKGIPVTYVGMGERTNLLVALQFPSILLKLIRILKTKRIDILHCQLFRANFIGAIAAKFAGVPIVITSILGGVREKRYHFWLYRLINKFIDMAIANSEASRQYALKKSGINENKTVTIYNGIDIESFKVSSNAETIKKEFGINPGQRVIGTVGRLHKIKGQEFLLRALPAIFTQYPDTKVLIVGGGELLEELKEKALVLNVSKNVVFTGERKDTADILSVLDVFTLPSLSEGISNAIIEAMSLGKPVVATDSGGTAELVINKETGLLVSPGNPEAIADAVLWLLNNDEKAREMGRRGKGVIEDKFLLSETVKRTEAVYEVLTVKKDL